MGYPDSYLCRLRQAVGNDLALMPGAMVALHRQDGMRIAHQARRRRDLAPACGAAEPGGRFAQTAINEPAEETRGRLPSAT